MDYTTQMDAARKGIVTKEMEAVAKKEQMEVEVSFTFNASALTGKNLVTFEELYDVTNPDEPVKVTEHKDITDEGQTVTIKEVPEEPEQPDSDGLADTLSRRYIAFHSQL